MDDNAGLPAAPESADAPVTRGDPPALPPPDPVLQGPARWLAGRGAGALVLALAALALAVLAVFTWLVDHPGLTGLLGLLAILLGEIARTPGKAGVPPDARAEALVRLSDLTLGAAFVLVALGTTVRVLLGLLVVGLLAWLPYLRALGAPDRIPPTAGLWRRPERLGVLMLGPLLGHPVVALLVVLVVGVFDAWVRIGRLAPVPESGRPPSFLAPFLGSDGALQPLVRWGSLALAVLLLLVLPRAAGWRF